MFKYVKFKRVKTDNTVLEFQQRDDKVKVHFFDVDAVSLEAENEQDIDELISIQEEAIEVKEITKEEFKTLVAKSSQIRRVNERVNQTYKHSLKAITQKYSEEERETWSNWQLPEAEKFSYTKDENDAPSLKILADDERVSLEDYANAVLAKARDYKTLSASALANKRMLKRELLSEIGL